MPLSPPLVLEVGNGSKFQFLPHFHIVRPSSGSIKELGSASGDASGGDAMSEITKSQEMHQVVMQVVMH